MAAAVYMLCAVTSLACALMLLRGSVAKASRFLLWCGLCFLGLTVNNVLLFVDQIVVPDGDLLIFRNLATLTAFAVLVYGLVVETAR